MFVYILIFIIAVAIYAFSNERNEQSRTVLAIYLGALAMFVGCADMLGGYDRYIYCEVFDTMSMSYHLTGEIDIEGSAGYQLFSAEWGFLWFNQLVAFVTMNRYVFIFILTVFVYTLLFVSISRYCRNYSFAVIVFLGLWFFFTFTYLRQVMAATIGWLSIKYVIERKPLPFFLIAFIAFIFHNSAIVLAPLYFIPIKKFKPILVVGGLIFCLLIGLTDVLSALFAVSDAIADEAKAEANVQLVEEGSFRVAYLIEAILFLALILWRYDSIDENDRKQVVMLNMAILFCAMLLLFVRSENGGRFSWHFMIGLIATVTHIATHPLHKDAPLSSGLIIMFAILFMRILILWNIQLSPYKSFFTDGHREGDIIFQVYEYDRKYDRDKFYK